MIQALGAGTLASTCLACAAQTPKFATIESPPAAEERRIPEPPAPRSFALPPSEQARAELVQRLFVALALGNQTEIEKLLWPQARLGRANQSLAEVTPAALAELMGLFRVSDTTTSVRSAQAENLPFFGARLLELSEGRIGTQSELSVLVDGSERIRGTWKIFVEHEGQPRIVRVVLPPQP